MKKRILFLLSILILLTNMNILSAAKLPESKPVYIELRYGSATNYRSWASTHTYFWFTDTYTKEERKICSEYIGGNNLCLEFDLYHPLYDEVIATGNKRYPFYAEPGDSLILNIGTNGKVESYARFDGAPMKNLKLLKYDISNTSFYTERDFSSDRELGLFPQFVERVVDKMAQAVDSVNKIAIEHEFSDYERALAVENTKLQFALWLFEYAPYKSGQIANYSRKHKSGWQNIESHDNAISTIENVSNYSFLRLLPMTDSVCLASRYFPLFVNSYENSHILKCDQYLYYGSTHADSLRMDSAFIAKDKQINLAYEPSLVMKIAMERKYMEIPPDYGFRLREVKVLAKKDETPAALPFTLSPIDVHNMICNSPQPTGFDLVGLARMILKPKSRNQKKKEQSVKLLDKYGEDDEERAKIMQMYKEGVSASKSK